MNLQRLKDFLMRTGAYLKQLQENPTPENMQEAERVLPMADRAATMVRQTAAPLPRMAGGPSWQPGAPPQPPTRSWMETEWQVTGEPPDITEAVQELFPSQSISGLRGEGVVPRAGVLAPPIAPTSPPPYGGAPAQMGKPFWYRPPPQEEAPVVQVQPFAEYLQGRFGAPLPGGMAQWTTGLPTVLPPTQGQAVAPRVETRAPAEEGAGAPPRAGEVEEGLLQGLLSRSPEPLIPQGPELPTTAPTQRGVSPWLPWVVPTTPLPVGAPPESPFVPQRPELPTTIAQATTVVKAQPPPQTLDEVTKYATPEERPALDRLRALMGEAPQLFTAENLVIALFMGAPAAIGNYLREKQAYQQRGFQLEAMGMRGGTVENQLKDILARLRFTNLANSPRVRRIQAEISAINTRYRDRMMATLSDPTMNAELDQKRNAEMLPLLNELRTLAGEPARAEIPD